MFDVSLQNVVTAYPVLMRLWAKPLSLRASRRISAILRTAQHDVELFERNRNALLQRLGVPTGQEGEYCIDPDMQLEWTKQMTEVLSERVTFPYDKIIESDLPDDFLITPAESAAFDQFLTG